MLLRRRAVPLLVLLLGLASMAVIATLQQRADRAQRARHTLTALTIELDKLQAAPFKADPTLAGSPTEARTVLQAGKLRIRGYLEELRRDSPPPALLQAIDALGLYYSALDDILWLGRSGAGFSRQVEHLATSSDRAGARIGDLLVTADREYSARASRMQTQATVGSAAVLLLLLISFAFLHRRTARARATAERLAEENERLLGVSRQEALTDALTGLPNRRSLMRDLLAHLDEATSDRQLMLALFDLDGFKQYNDTYGHPAGDTLLSRLGSSLGASLTGRGTAYRMGGDEFCVLAPVAAEEVDEIVALAAEGLSEHGDGFDVGCSHGAALVPAEASTAEAALHLADERMYEHKASRSSAGRQSTDVLLTALSERGEGLYDHLLGVARLAALTARQLALPEHECKRVELAAELHDVGKVAIPDQILHKHEPLDPHDWEFMHQHTVIGERIVRAAPSLAHVAALVRSSHERFDGSGYPDRLRGEEIPLGARIIAVCDAFDVMVSARAYDRAFSPAEALAELRRCAGTQFDPAIVVAFCALADQLEPSGQAAA